MKLYLRPSLSGYKRLPPSALASRQGTHFSTFVFFRETESPQPPIAGFLLTFH